MTYYLENEKDELAAICDAANCDEAINKICEETCTPENNWSVFRLTSLNDPVIFKTDFS